VAIEGGNPLTVVNKGYGWKPGLPDIRDYRLNFSGAEVAPEVDLRKTGYAAQIWDQGPLGSCTAHGAGFAYAFDLEKQGQGDDFTPSRLYIYYNTRVIEGTVSEDSGASITDAIKSINKYGAPPEADWQYNTDRFTEKPSVQAYTDGALRQAVKYARVNQTVADMQACLTAGTPIVIGFTVYESFESQAVADTGDVPMPTTSEQVMGGHCVAVVGYIVRNGKPVWICRNSWGTSWGDEGYFYMPQAYLVNRSLASDFWTVQSVSSPDPTPQPPTPAPTPTPTPTPAPVADEGDKALWKVAGDWASVRHIGQTKKVASALKLWAKGKSL
jgi:C1A family cysteine protease